MIPTEAARMIERSSYNIFIEDELEATRYSALWRKRRWLKQRCRAENVTQFIDFVSMACRLSIWNSMFNQAHGRMPWIAGRCNGEAAITR